ncbi:MAG: PLP-dependent aminotransferase family protein [Chitinispirillaceae bacterium]
MKSYKTSTLSFQPAKRVLGIPRSGIRELLSNSQNKKIISFGGGVPHDSRVPLALIEDAFEKVLSRCGTQAFRYGSSEGEPSLREQISNWLKSLGMNADPDHILIVNGSQQGLDLLGKVLINPGSRVLLERPTYLAALQAFCPYAPAYDEIELDSEGTSPLLLEDRLKRGNYRFFYTIPSFQNPSGAYSPEERRIKTAQLLNRYNTLLVEDDPYSQLYYDQNSSPKPLCSFGVRNAVFLGTFSKMVAPGFRLGWVWSNSDILRHILTVKQAADLCTGRFQQLLLSELLENIDLNRHLKNNRMFYTQQRNTMQQFMLKHLSEHMEWSTPRGGMFFWAKLKDGLSAEGLLDRCFSRGVAFSDGSAFFASNQKKEFLRLNFTQCTEAEMDDGLEVIKEEIEKMKMN